LKTDAVKTAKRTLDILEAFGESQEPLSLSDIARQIGSPVSSCHGVLRTLKGRGYVYLLDTRRYYPTRKLLDLGSRIAEHDPIMERLIPHLEALHARTEETVMIGKRQDEEVLYLLSLESPQAIRYTIRAGDRRPLHASAIGKALLGQLPDERLLRQLRQLKLQRYTETTLTSAERLAADIRNSRKRGYFVTRGEYSAGGMGVAAPFTVASEAYAIAVAGPLPRMKTRLASVGRAVVDSAEALSRAMQRI
jgi:IclR family acetate operon transcriptional repressor